MSPTLFVHCASFFCTNLNVSRSSDSQRLLLLHYCSLNELKIADEVEKVILFKDFHMWVTDGLCCADVL